MVACVDHFKSVTYEVHFHEQTVKSKGSSQDFWNSTMMKFAINHKATNSGIEGLVCVRILIHCSLKYGKVMIEPQTETQRE